MSNSNKDFQELKAAFEGKTIVSVDPPEAAEAIAKFTMSDGSCFRLHATDLGYWMESTIGKNQPYKSLETLLVDCYHYAYCNAINVEPYVVIAENQVEFHHHGKSFYIDRKFLNEWETKVITHPKAPVLLAYAAMMGDAWRVAFSNTSADCPKELVLPSL
jgi:hypothetical protein